MKRYHSETHITKRNHRNHLKIHGWPKKPVDCPCDKQAGRFRKKDAYDCGNTKCFICHSNKLPKRTKTKQEEKSDLYLKESQSPTG